MNNKLENLRKQIDAIDKRVLTSLAKRMEIVRKIGGFKKDQRLPAFNKERWEQILKSNLKKGESLGLSKNFVQNLTNLIHKYSIEIQKKINRRTIFYKN